jgi:very-short-patch-repair endonuclease
MRDKLEARGMRLVPQYGCSGYRIDFAVRHPDQPGAYVLAIEADGATYHSLPTARDRDRLRQEHLERLGWRFHRIWSTSWFRDSATEVEKAYAAYLDAVASRTAFPAPAHASAPIGTVIETGNVDGKAERSPFPVMKCQPIDRYTDIELQSVAEWVLADGRIRTTVDLIDEMRISLGFQRRGSKFKVD